MGEIKLNKTELKNQKNLLSQLTKYLPTLQLKKQQLQVEVEVAKNGLEKIENDLKKDRELISKWSILLSQKITIDIFQLLQIEKIVSTKENIAGVEVPIFKDLVFKMVNYSNFNLPFWVDKAFNELRKLVRLREEIKITKKKLDLLEEELRQTNIKVNLFEKRMIPECKENIRKIKIFLGDQEIAAICNAKIAKDKLKRKELMEAV